MTAGPASEGDTYVTPEERRLRALEGDDEETRRISPAREAHDALEAALFEIKRIIVGQEAMLERVIVALLAGGHVLLEGVPGLAKTLTVKTVSDVLGGAFKRLQFTPDPPPPARWACGSSACSPPPPSCPRPWGARGSTGPTRAASTPSSAPCSATSC